MQFLVTAFDCKFGGLERRLAVRENHLKLIEDLRQQKNVCTLPDWKMMQSNQLDQ